MSHNTDHTDSAEIFSPIDELILSDTFITWFNTTNEIIEALNPLRIYDVIGGDGIKEVRSGGTVELSVDAGPGLKSVDVESTGDKYFTLDFLGLPQDDTDGERPEEDDVFCYERLDSDAIDGSLLKKVPATNMLPTIIADDHTFTGEISYTGGHFLETMLTFLTDCTNDTNGLRARRTDITGGTDVTDKEWTMDCALDAWYSNVNIAVDYLYGFVSNSPTSEAVFTFKSDTAGQEDVLLALQCGDPDGTGEEFDTWYFKAVHDEHKLIFALNDFEGDETESFGSIMQLERVDATDDTWLYNQVRFTDRVYFDNISSNYQFSNDPLNGVADIIPLTDTDGFLDERWFNRRSESNYDPSIALGMAVCYDVDGLLIPAKADTIETSTVVGIVERISGGTVQYCARGDMDYNDGDLIVGTMYYLSPIHAGQITELVPTEPYHCIRPILVAISNNSDETSGVVINIENWGREIDITPRSTAGRLVITTDNFDPLITAGDVVRFDIDIELEDIDSTEDATEAATDATDGLVGDDFVDTDGVEADDVTDNEVTRSWEDLRLVRARASSFKNSLAVGIVESIKTINGVNYAVVVIRGEINNLTDIQDRGVYYLDDVVYGQKTLEEPTAVGTVSKVLMYGIGTDRGFVDIEASNKINGFVVSNSLQATNWDDSTDTGLAVGDLVRYEFTTDAETGSDLIKIVHAQADTEENAKVVGMVDRILGSDGILYVTTFGEAQNGLSGLEEAETYYLSATTPGGFTDTPPTGGNTVVREIGYGSHESKMFIKIGDGYINNNDTNESFTSTSFAADVDRGDWVRYNDDATQFVKADAFDYSSSMVVGLVTELYEAPSGTDTITIVTRGFVSNMGDYMVDLTPGYIYHLSHTPATGSMTDNLPTGPMSVRKKLFVATSTASGYVDIGESKVNDDISRVVFTEEFYTTDLTVGDWVRYEMFAGQQHNTDEEFIDLTDSTDTLCSLYSNAAGRLFQHSGGFTHNEWTEDNGMIQYLEQLGYCDIDGCDDLPDGMEFQEDFSCPCEAMEYIDLLIAAGIIGSGSHGQFLYVPGAQLDSFDYPTQNLHILGFHLQEYLDECSCNTDYSCPDDSCFANGGTIGIEEPAADIFGTDTDGTIVDLNDDIPAFTYLGIKRPVLQFGDHKAYIIYFSHTSDYAFKISETPDGTHGGGIEYTDGIYYAGSADDPTTSYMCFRTDENTPRQLYYYDPNTAGVGGSITVTNDRELCAQNKEHQRLTRCQSWLDSSLPSPAGAFCVGVIECFHNNRAVVVTQGLTNKIWSTIRPGAIYYLSDEVLGRATRSRPSSTFSVRVPVMIAADNFRGIVNIGAYESSLEHGDFYVLSTDNSIPVGSAVSIVGNSLVMSLASTEQGSKNYYTPIGITIEKKLWSGSSYIFTIRSQGTVRLQEWADFNNGQGVFDDAIGEQFYLSPNTSGGYIDFEVTESGQVVVPLGRALSNDRIMINLETPVVILGEVDTVTAYDPAAGNHEISVVYGSTEEDEVVSLLKQDFNKVLISDGTVSLARIKLTGMSHDGQMMTSSGVHQNLQIGGTHMLHFHPIEIYHDSAKASDPNTDEGEYDTDSDGNWVYTTDMDTEITEREKGLNKLYMAYPRMAQGSGALDIKDADKVRYMELTVTVDDDDKDLQNQMPRIWIGISMDSGKDWRAEVEQNTDGTDIIDEYPAGAEYYENPAILDVIVVGQQNTNWNWFAEVEVTSVNKPAPPTDAPTEDAPTDFTDSTSTDGTWE